MDDIPKFQLRRIPGGEESAQPDNGRFALKFCGPHRIAMLRLIITSAPEPCRGHFQAGLSPGNEGRSRLVAKDSEYTMSITGLKSSEPELIALQWHHCFHPDPPAVAHIAWLKLPPSLWSSSRKCH